MKQILDADLPGYYCESCPYLEPEVRQEADIYAGRKLYQKGKKYIACENAYLCERLLTYLQGYMSDK